MTNDMYLSLAIELFEKGTWSKEVFIKRIILYAKEKNMNMADIDEIIDRLTKPKEYTIEEKRKFLSLVTILGDELKYGDAVSEMSDEMVEKFYEMEKESLEKDKVETLHNMVKSSQNKENIAEEEVVEEQKEDAVVETVLEVPEKENDVFVYPENEENFEFEVVGNQVFVFPGEIEEISKEVVSESATIIDNNTKFLGGKSINDIIHGNYTVNDILGNTNEEREERFKFLVENVKVEDLRDVANSLVNKLDPSYCLNFTIEWEKIHNEELKDEEIRVENEIVTKKEEAKVDETVSPLMGSAAQELENDSVEELSVNEEGSIPRFVIPKLSFDSYGEDDLPRTEEEYKEQAENISKTEKDSNVRKVNISPERLAKLKKTKNKAINCFLKTGMVILAFNLLNPLVAIGTVGSYMYFAEEIRCGTFNPKNPVGKAIKYAVEKVMNIGIKKDKENERGKAK